jgi:hypothetical protein
LAPNFRIYKLLFLDCTQKFRQIYNLFWQHKWKFIGFGCRGGYADTYPYFT